MEEIYNEQNVCVFLALGVFCGVILLLSCLVNMLRFLYLFIYFFYFLFLFKNYIYY